ncbi:MAG: hypothetical protein U1F27_14935 [Turneriella sp.]
MGQKIAGSGYPTLLTAALFCGTWLVAAPLTVTEKKAVRREMIEMDIAVRNLTTIVATGDRKMLDDSLQRLVGWQMKDNPELGKTLRNVIARWDQSGAGKFATQVQREAQAMRAYAGGRGKFNTQDWSRTTQGLGKILTSCQGCHEMTRKENP